MSRYMVQQPISKMKSVDIPNRPNHGHRKNYHMKFVRRTMLLIGIWPVKTGYIKEFLYELYFWTTFIYYVVFSISGLVLAILTWSNDYLTTASIMGIVIEYFSNAYKVLIFKSKTIKALIFEIKEKEKEIFESNNSEIVEIYTRNAALNRKIVIFYTIMGTMGISFYSILPLYNNTFFPLGFNNETGLKNHYLIMSSWFPFDPNRYYSAAYLIQFTGCLIGYCYIVHCGAFYISMLSFVTAHLKILQHVFINFPKYTDNFKYQYKLSEEQSQFVLLRKLVQEHLEIIDFVRRINNAIRLFTLMNFVISSIQLSLVAYQLLKGPLLQRIAFLFFFSTLSLQLFLTYQAAHTITMESENIAASIFKGNWDTYPPKVLKILQMICIRAQKPLVLTIGPIADVKLASLYQIYKALYSYICIIMQM